MSLCASASLAALVVLGLTACGSTAAPDAAASATAETAATPTADAPEPTTTATGGPAAAPPTGPAAPAPAGTMIPPPGAASPAADGPLEAAPLPSTAAELGEQVAFDTGMLVEIVSVEAIQVDAETPGELSGPALAVTVAARNASAEPQSVDSAVVVVETADGEVGIGTTAGDPSPLAGVIDPGGSASGRYVFMLEPAAGREVTVTVNYAAGEPVAVFTGTSS